MIDGSVGTAEDDLRTPSSDYEVLMNELKHYNNGLLLKKPSLIVSRFKINYSLPKTRPRKHNQNICLSFSIGKS